MELKTLLDAEVARLDEEAEFADKEYQRLRKAILAGKDVEDNLDDLKYVLKQRQDAYNACNAFDYDKNPIATAYELYKRMGGVLTDEFGGTDDNEGRIVFPWHGRTLGLFLNY